MPPKPTRRAGPSRRPAEPSSPAQAPLKHAPETQSEPRKADALGLGDTAGTPPLEAQTDAPQAAGGAAPRDVVASAADSEEGGWAVPSDVAAAEPATGVGSRPETSVSKAGPRPPTSRPPAQPHLLQSPQPAYTPTMPSGLPEQFMDVDQVGKPSLDELRVVVLKWVKETNDAGKEYVVYVLEVSAAGRRYKIRRRWSQISEFHAQLKRLNSGLSKAERYTVRFVDKWSSTLDPGQLDGRKAELATYFRGVTEWAMGPLKRATKPIDLLRVPQVAQFLTTDADVAGLRISGSGFGSDRRVVPVSPVSPTPPEGVPPTGAHAAGEFQVIARFDKPGIMGFDFDRDTLQVGSLQGPAEEVPHAVEGMVLRWVMHGEEPSAKKVYLLPNQPAEFEALVTDPTRPVTLGFAHPWQAHGEGDDRYYYNSFSDESVWEMPQQIVSLLESQGVPAVTTSIDTTVSDVSVRGGGGTQFGHTQLRVEIDRLDFTNPTEAKLIEMMVITAINPRSGHVLTQMARWNPRTTVAVEFNVQPPVNILLQGFKTLPMVHAAGPIMESRVPVEQPKGDGTVEMESDEVMVSGTGAEIGRSALRLRWLTGGAGGGLDGTSESLQNTTW